MSGLSLWPTGASTFAPQVDHLFVALLAISGLVCAGVFGLIVYFCVRYREGNPAPRPEPPAHRTALEIAWMAVPLLIFLGLFAWAGFVYLRMYAPPEGGLRVYAVGQQWMWKLQYPDGRREINTLHVPVGEDVTVVLSSQDVIHSFFVPAFRIKKDAVPGRYTRLWFRATKPGRYHLFCAQYCGTDHAAMIGEVVVLSRDDYAAWSGHPAEPEGLAAEGGRLYRDLGCAACHGPGTTQGPRLEGLYGQTVTLLDGTTVQADETYLRDALLLPNKEVVAGYAPVMPTYQGRLSAEQLNALIAYLVSLGAGPKP